MIASKLLREAIGELLAADSSTLAPAANANKIALAQSGLAEDESLDFAGIVFADFDGSDPILGTTGTQEVGLDPQTGEQIITMKEPLGGWRWAVTGSTNLPQTIQGYVLVDNGVTGWIGLAIFDNPITLTEIGQQIDIGFATFRVVLQPLS